MKTILLSAAALLMAPAIAAAQDFTGSWTMELDIAGMKYPGACAFTQTGNTLGGTCGGADGKTVTVSGTVDGAKATFAYDTVYQGNPLHLAYTGEAKSDKEMAGAVDAQIAQGTFTATKQ
jgi:hypothetical protein